MLNIANIEKLKSTHNNVSTIQKESVIRMFLDKEYGTCPIEYTLGTVGGKWKLLILYFLMTDKVKRYGELKRSVTGITHKMLSAQLKELENDGLILRNEYQQTPPKVEYSLTNKGVTLLPILGMMYEWGKENMSKV